MWILDTKYVKSALLVAAWTANGKDWQDMTIDDTGNAERAVHFWWATEGGQVSPPFHPKDPKRIQSYLDRLPASEVDPGKDKVLWAAFRRNGHREIRIYNRFRAPNALIELYRYLNAGYGDPRNPVIWQDGQKSPPSTG
jgi:hypothetical protein